MDPNLPHPTAVSSDGPLTIGECLALLRSVPHGQLVYTDNALPAVRPVTFAAPQGDIVIPTDRNPWFHRFDGAVLALEAGTIDPFTRTGWTVLAVGRSRLVVGTDTLTGFDDPAGTPWDPAPGDCYLVIDVGHLSGQRTTLLRPDGDRR